MLRVLSRPAFRNRRVNPYNALINDHLATHDVSIEEYRPYRPLRRFYDVVHVHWPETTFNHGVVSAAVTTESLLLALKVARQRGGKVLWTAHNLFAKEQRYPEWEAVFWRRFTPLLDGIITLSKDGLTDTHEAFPELSRKPGWVLPHPHYRGQYPDGLTRKAARSLLGLPEDARVILFFGNIQDHKDLPKLIEAFQVLAKDEPRLNLLVAGKPHHAGVAEEARRKSANHPRIHLTLRHIQDEEVQRFFRACDLVVLPYRVVSNSGSALLALSFDRPVMMPRLGPLPYLQRMVGSEWVHLYERWSAEILRDALRRLPKLPERTGGQQLAAFSPEAVAAKSAQIYRALVSGQDRISDVGRPSSPPAPP